jgi:hypothetical protein
LAAVVSQMTPIGVPGARGSIVFKIPPYLERVGAAGVEALGLAAVVVGAALVGAMEAVVVNGGVVLDATVETGEVVAGPVGVGDDEPQAVRTIVQTTRTNVTTNSFFIIIPPLFSKYFTTMGGISLP